MDRLPSLILGVTLAGSLLLGACDDEPDVEADAPAASSRFEGIAAAPSGIDAALRDTCDVMYRAEEAPRFAFPETTEPPAVRAGAWTWVNFWATWCHPCVEEMPMLIEAIGKTSTALAFVSADSDDAVVADFRRDHDMPESGARLVSAASLGPALEAVGFTAPASLPVHVLLDEQGHVRCVRAGAVERHHVDAILEALGETTRRPRIR
jgi:thiol-disulfide isomerase/thioredoxin